jgi:D-alanyl-lipoteichoic acid acyltransferase DltB (MBOAT superfamily)
MTITSWSFIAFLAISTFVFCIAPGHWRARYVFPATTLVFIFLVMPSATATFVVLGFVGLLWISTRIIYKWPARSIQVAALSIVLLVFGWMKAYEFLAFLPFAGFVPATIGLSYMLIRSMQLLVDIADTPTLRPGFLQIFSFMTSWPCLISGPIQRFQDFRDQLLSMEACTLDGDVLFTAMQRMIKGYFLVLVLADATKHMWLGLQEISLANPYPIALAGAQVAFLVHLFFDFSGYMHIVIGAGYLFGLRLPENFDHPWQSKSFLEFWGRWHMTMSNWFKTYVFNAVLMALVKRWPSAKLSDLHGGVAFFLTFFLVGLWHGTTWAFALCGFLLGMGASVNQTYRNKVRRWLGKKRFEALAERKFYSLAAATLAFTYICFSITPLWLSFGQIKTLVASYTLSGLFAAESVLFLMLLLSLPAIQWWQQILTLPGLRWRAALITGFQCAVIDAYVFLFPAIGGAFFYEQF